MFTRYNIDAVEKQTLQTALDNLQNNICIKSRSHFVEKLGRFLKTKIFLKYSINLIFSLFIILNHRIDHSSAKFEIH